jgi:hypothetical protein
MPSTAQAHEVTEGIHDRLGQPFSGSSQPRQDPPFRRDQGRSVWQNDLFEWFNSGKAFPPPKNAPFWVSAAVFVERIELVELQPREGSRATPLGLHLKVHGRDDTLLWGLAEANQSALRQKLPEIVKAATNGRVELHEITIRRGSVTIGAVLIAASHAIVPILPLLTVFGIIISIISLIANYPALKRGVFELQRDVRKAIEAIEQFLREFFGKNLDPGIT